MHTFDVTKGSALVRRLAAQFRRTRMGYEWEEMVASGMLGLCEAAATYRERGLSFWDWAERHIGWAIADGRRKALMYTRGPGLGYAKTVRFKREHDRAVHGDAEIKLLAKEMLAVVPPRARNILACVYLGVRTQSSAAREIGISKSWMSRRHKRALEVARQAA